jgi:hypothetical protein
MMHLPSIIVSSGILQSVLTDCLLAIERFRGRFPDIVPTNAWDDLVTAVQGVRDFRKSSFFSYHYSVLTLCTLGRPIDDFVPASEECFWASPPIDLPGFCRLASHEAQNVAWLLVDSISWNTLDRA